MLESPRARALLAASLGLLGLALPPLSAQAPADGSEPIRITRAAGPIEVDGNLDDPGWKGAVRIDTFYETNPGDSVPPKVKSVAWLTYDDHFFYAAFEFSDPNPKAIRAPYGDHDETPSYTDYGGIILDTQNDGKTAAMFLANPRGIQYDAISSDVSGEDNSPDFYWDSAARIGPDGWRLEIRVPFSSLRYNKADPQIWNVLLYRNYPRDFRYQMFNAKLPRESSCFICHAQKIVGLTGLPSGNHIVLAPYATGKLNQTAAGDPGSRLSGGTKWDGGLDAKWNPNAVTAVDATINPDFSQVESDVAQISTNERFALFFPEKRPFFLEGLDLFSTPIQAVYTRTITSPSWGVRSTGQLDGVRYTALVADDRGGGASSCPARWPRPSRTRIFPPGSSSGGRGATSAARTPAFSLPIRRLKAAATTGSSGPTSSGGLRTTTRSGASSSTATRGLPTVPSLPPSGMAAASNPTPPLRSGATAPRPGTGCCNCRTLATPSGPI